MNTIINSAGQEQRVPSFAELVAEEITFSDQAFGPSRSYLGPLNHLRKEIEEVIAADNLCLGEDPSNGSLMEFADCLLLLIDAYRLRHRGLPPEKLLVAAWNKIQINKRRDWGKPDNNGVIEHIRNENNEKPIQ